MQSISQTVSEYLGVCQHQRNLDKKTVKAYRIDLYQFEKFLTDGQYELGRESIAKYVAKMNERLKPRSVKRKIASIKAFCSYLLEQDYMSDNPFSKLRVNVKTPLILPRTIPLRSIEQLLTASYSQINEGKTPYQRERALRDTAVMELLFSTGIRVSELCKLRVGDIDLAEGDLRIYGKGAKERIIQIGNQSVLQLLNDYCKKKSLAPNDPLFLNRNGNRLSDQSVRLILNRYAQQVSIGMSITPHMFRHSFATYLLEEGVDIRYIQKLLGHSSIMTTQIYTHVATAKQKSILIQKHPRNKILR